MKKIKIIIQKILVLFVIVNLISSSFYPVLVYAQGSGEVSTPLIDDYGTYADEDPLLSQTPGLAQANDINKDFDAIRPVVADQETQDKTLEAYDELAGKMAENTGRGNAPERIEEEKKAPGRSYTLANEILERGGSVNEVNPVDQAGRLWNGFTGAIAGIGAMIKNAVAPDEETRQAQQATQEAKKEFEAEFGGERIQKAERRLADLAAALASVNAEEKAKIVQALGLGTDATDADLYFKFNGDKGLQIQGDPASGSFVITTQYGGSVRVLYESPGYGEWSKKEFVQRMEKTGEIVRDLGTLGLYSAVQRFPELKEQVLPKVVEACSSTVDTNSNGFKIIVGEYQGGSEICADPTTCVPQVSDIEKEEAKAAAAQIKANQGCYDTFTDYTELMADAYAGITGAVLNFVDPIVVVGATIKAIKFINVTRRGADAAMRLAGKSVRVSEGTRVVHPSEIIRAPIPGERAPVAGVRPPEIREVPFTVVEEGVREVGAVRRFEPSSDVAGVVAPRAGEEAAEAVRTAGQVPGKTAAELYQEEIEGAIQDGLRPVAQIETGRVAREAADEAVALVRKDGAEKAAEEAAAGAVEETIARVGGPELVPNNPVSKAVAWVEDTVDGLFGRRAGQEAVGLTRAEAREAIDGAAEEAARLVRGGRPVEEAVAEAVDGSLGRALGEIVDGEAKDAAEKAGQAIAEKGADIAVVARVAREKTKETVAEVGRRLVGGHITPVRVEPEAGVFSGKTPPADTGQVKTVQGHIQLRVEKNGVVHVGEAMPVAGEEEISKGVKTLLQPSEPQVLPYHGSEFSIEEALGSAGITPRITRGEFGNYYELTENFPEISLGRKMYLRFKDTESFAEFLKRMQPVVSELEQQGINLNFKLQDEIVFYIIADPRKVRKEALDAIVDRVSSTINSLNEGGIIRAEQRGIYTEDPLGLLVQKDQSPARFTSSTRQGNSNDSLLSTELIPPLAEIAERHAGRLRNRDPKDFYPYILKVFEENPAARQEMIDKYREITGVTFRDFADPTKARAIPIAVNTSDSRVVREAIELASRLEDNGYKVAIIDSASITQKGYLDRTVLTNGGFPKPAEGIESLVGSLPNRIVAQTEEAMGQIRDTIGGLLGRKADDATRVARDETERAVAGVGRRLVGVPEIAGVIPPNPVTRAVQSVTDSAKGAYDSTIGKVFGRKGKEIGKEAGEQVARDAREVVEGAIPPVEAPPPVIVSQETQGGGIFGLFKRKPTRVEDAKNITTGVEDFVDNIDNTVGRLTGRGEPEQAARIQPTREPTAQGTIANNTKGGVNEDTALVNYGEGVAAVFDGAGGHSIGDVASGIAKNTFESVLTRELSEQPSTQQVLMALRAAYDRAIESMRGFANVDPTMWKDMGTTATVVKVFTEGEERKMAILSVGDTRAYGVNNNGRIHQLTQDEGMLAGHVADGRITSQRAREIQRELDEVTDASQLSPEEAFYYKNRNMTNLFTPNRPSTPTVEVFNLGENADYILIASDGVHDNLTASQIEAIVKSASSPQEAVDNLVAAARENAGRQLNHRAKDDDITAVAMDVSNRGRGNPQGTITNPAQALKNPDRPVYMKQGSGGGKKGVCAAADGCPIPTVVQKQAEPKKFFSGEEIEQIAGRLEDVEVKTFRLGESDIAVKVGIDPERSLETGGKLTFLIDPGQKVVGNVTILDRAGNVINLESITHPLPFENIKRVTIDGVDYVPGRDAWRNPYLYRVVDKPVNPAIVPTVETISGIWETAAANPQKLDALLKSRLGEDTYQQIGSTIEAFKKYPELITFFKTRDFDPWILVPLTPEKRIEELKRVLGYSWDGFENTALFSQLMDIVEKLSKGQLLDLQEIGILKAFENKDIALQMNVRSFNRFNTINPLNEGYMKANLAEDHILRDMIPFGAFGTHRDDYTEFVELMKRRGVDMPSWFTGYSETEFRYGIKLDGAKANAGGQYFLDEQLDTPEGMALILNHEKIHGLEDRAREEAFKKEVQYVTPEGINAHESFTEALALLVHHKGNVRAALTTNKVTSIAYQPGVEELLKIVEEINSKSGDNLLGTELLLKGILERRNRSINELEFIREYYDKFIAESEGAFERRMERYTDSNLHSRQRGGRYEGSSKAGKEFPKDAIEGAVRRVRPEDVGARDEFGLSKFGRDMEYAIKNPLGLFTGLVHDINEKAFLDAVLSDPRATQQLNAILQDYYLNYAKDIKGTIPDFQTFIEEALKELNQGSGGRKVGITPVSRIQFGAKTVYAQEEGSGKNVIGLTQLDLLVKQRLLKKKLQEEGFIDSKDVDQMMKLDIFSSFASRKGDGYVFKTGHSGSAEAYVFAQRYRTDVFSIPNLDIKIPGVVEVKAGQETVIPVAIKEGSGRVEKLGYIHEDGGLLKKAYAQEIGADEKTGKVTVVVFADKNNNGKFDKNEKILPWAGLTVELKRVSSERVISLSEGDNQVTLPILPDKLLTASILLREIALQDGDAISVSTQENGAWKTYVAEGAKSYSFEDFPILPEKSYSVRSRRDSTFLLKGQEFVAPR